MAGHNLSLLHSVCKHQWEGWDGCLSTNPNVHLKNCTLRKKKPALLLKWHLQDSPFMRVPTANDSLRWSSLTKEFPSCCSQGITLANQLSLSTKFSLGEIQLSSTFFGLSVPTRFTTRKHLAWEWIKWGTVACKAYVNTLLSNTGSFTSPPTCNLCPLLIFSLWRYFIYLEGRITARSSTCWFTLQMTAMAVLCWARQEAMSLALHLDLPCGWAILWCSGRWMSRALDRKQSNWYSGLSHFCYRIQDPIPLVPLGRQLLQM